MEKTPDACHRLAWRTRDRAPGHPAHMQAPHTRDTLGVDWGGGGAGGSPTVTKGTHKGTRTSMAQTCGVRSCSGWTRNLILQGMTHRACPGGPGRSWHGQE